MQEKCELPNLWIFKDAIEILQSGKISCKTNVSLQKIVSEDHLYIPAERIRELIAEEEVKTMPLHLYHFIKALEAIIGPEK